MMRKSRKKGGARWLLWGLALGAAALLATGGDGLQAQATGSRTPTAESIREKEEEISQIKEQKEGLKDGLSNLQEIKKNLELQKDDLKNYAGALYGLSPRRAHL